MELESTAVYSGCESWGILSRGYIDWGYCRGDILTGDIVKEIYIDWGILSGETLAGVVSSGI